jgi:hypothetical protein
MTNALINMHDSVKPDYRSLLSITQSGFLGRPRPLFPELEPLVGIMESLPLGRPIGVVSAGSGAFAGISSSLSDSSEERSTFFEPFPFTLVKLDKGPLIVAVVVVFDDPSPLRLD